jgi:hypothetical protein
MAWALSWLFKSSSPRSAALSTDVSVVPFMSRKRLQSMFLESRTVAGWPGLYCRPEAQLDWCLLAFGHRLLHSLGMAVASIAFASSTDGPCDQLGLAVKRSVQSLSAKKLSPWKLMLRDGLNLYGVSPSLEYSLGHPPSLHL